MDSQELKKEIPEFEIIEPGLYRGGQPTEKGLELLKQGGVRTVINFRHEKDLIEWEREKVRELGLHYVSLPWRIQMHPQPAVMQEFLKQVQKKEDGPFFMHCRRGAERTGVADAVYRHFDQKLSPETAYSKATEGHQIRFYWKPFMRVRYDEFLKECGSPDGASAG